VHRLRRERRGRVHQHLQPCSRRMVRDGRKEGRVWCGGMGETGAVSDACAADARADECIKPALNCSTQRASGLGAVPSPLRVLRSRKRKKPAGTFPVGFRLSCCRSCRGALLLLVLKDAAVTVCGAGLPSAGVSDLRSRRDGIGLARVPVTIIGEAATWLTGIRIAAHRIVSIVAHTGVCFRSRTATGIQSHYTANVVV
jgi:hypothetical protein